MTDTKHETTATLRRGGRYSPGLFEIHSGMAVLGGLGLKDLRALRDTADVILEQEEEEEADDEMTLNLQNPYRGLSLARIEEVSSKITARTKRTADGDLDLEADDAMAMALLDEAKASLCHGDRWAQTAFLGRALANLRIAIDQGNEEAARLRASIKRAFDRIA